MGLEFLHKDVWDRCSEPEPHRTHTPGIRRQRMPQPQCGTAMRGCAVPYRLRRGALERLEHMHHHLRRRHAEPQPRRRDPTPLRRQGLRRAHAGAGVLRWTLPYPLRRVELDELVHVHKELRHGHAEPLAQHRDARRAWRIRVPAHG